MRALVASDLHGDFAAARRLAERFALERADRIWLLGDLLAGRPGPDADGERTARLLGALASRITAVRGNCDGVFDERRLALALPAYVFTELNGRRVLLTHGHLYGRDRLPAAPAPDLICEGHTHVASLVRRGGTILLNPGSASAPRGNGPAGYAVVDGEDAALKDLGGATLAALAW